MKSIIKKSIFVIVVWAVLSVIKSSIAPVVTIDMSLKQLEDSDFAWMQWNSYGKLLAYYWVLYLLPLLVFVPNVKKLFKQN